MPSLSQLVEKAEWWAAPNPYRPTPEDLLYICQTAKCKQVPSLKNAKDSLNRLPNGVYIGSAIKHWCGIFAVCVCNEVGLNLEWDLMKGHIVGNVTLTWGHSGVQPGDIAGVAAHQHHFLVTSMDDVTGSVLAVEGNTFNQQIKSGSSKQVGSISYYYRPTGLI